ncbi:WAT1-RELATED PROTEIN [Salix viminalis]|uniref:WAT1-related protein n=1 Tax=Salix viminalis TaxID=40686 RepID=A0A9Q0QAC0_SALVM|nr:WAT1-RELATED PROTEIN [Salix viminalis]
MGGKVAVLPVVGMIMAECAQAGRMIAGKAAMSNGLSSFVFVLYSHTIASIILLPSSLIFNRQQERPPLTLSIVSGFFLLGSLSGSCLGQSFGYAGINLSSPELGTAMLNTVPGLTFVLAVIFRMEKLDCRSYSTLAKSMGTIVSMGGAFVVTFYKGPLVLEALPSASDSSHQVLSQDSNWVLGGLLLAADCAMASSWLIVQASILKKYSAKSVVVFFYFFFSTILSLLVSLVMVRDPSAWSLKSKTRLISVLFSGILGHAFQVGVTTWCLQKTGPLFVSIFAPLGIVITATVSVIFFGDALNLGILIGAVIIASGFYAVIWGKSQEAIKKVDDEENSGPASSSQKVPLLQNRSSVDA